MAFLLVLYAVFQLKTFVPLFFVDDPMFYERSILALVVVARFVWLLRHATDRPTAYSRGTWLLLAAGATLMTLAQTLVPSQSLSLYGFLVFAAGLAHLFGGPTVGRRTSMMLAGLALLIFPPRIIHEPVLAWLQSLSYSSSTTILEALFANVRGTGDAIEAGGLSIAFTASCAGAPLMMTFAAFPLILSPSPLNPRRLADMLVLALALGFLLNVARVVTVVTLARAGYLHLALGGGHALVGEAFVFVGVLALLYAMSYATSRNTSGRGSTTTSVLSSSDGHASRA
jgi:exosortase/archaeosortase family protein